MLVRQTSKSDLSEAQTSPDRWLRELTSQAMGEEGDITGVGRRERHPRSWGKRETSQELGKERTSQELGEEGDITGDEGRGRHPSRWGKRETA